MRVDIAPGGTFADYELPGHDNAPRRLGESHGDDPIILTLGRGDRRFGARHPFNDSCGSESRPAPSPSAA